MAEPLTPARTNLRASMMLTDPIADMLTRIRNAHLALHKEVCKGFLVWNRCHGDMLFTGLKYS